ncbi:blastula protease 10-like [Penaeus indicus]|uniref:blastula protease 10-like n=1 Tax=Penaeus indicus TaxID=29960 RepID=UPI00300C7018
MSGNSAAGGVSSAGFSLALLIFVLSFSLGLVRAEIDLEDLAAKMPLCPAHLPDDVPDEALELLSSLSLDLLNPTTVNGTDILVEADVVMSQQQWDEIHEAATKGAPRKAIPWGWARWPVSQSTGLPTAIYRIDSSVRSPAMIRSGMNDWESHTCVRFVEASSTNEPYINVFEGNGCYSYIGKTGKIGQELSIGLGCYTADIIKHELGHALGLFHEQTRGDRDEYVQILTDNVRPGVEYNFQKQTTADYGQAYDFSSLMHYTSTSFSKNGGSTIVTLDPAMQIYVGQSDDLTFRDIAIVNHMYGCSDLWAASCSSSPPTCENGGYLGSNCACKCPPGTSGSTCADITGSYYPTPVCGGNITAATTIKTPNYPYKFPRGTNCVWWIRAPDECQYPIVTVNDFSLFRRASNGQCVWDRLEVRTDSLYSGSALLQYIGLKLKMSTFATKRGVLSGLPSFIVKKISQEVELLCQM